MKTLKFHLHLPKFLKSYHLTVLKSYRLTVLKSYRLTVLKSYRLTVLKSYRLTVLQSYRLIVLSSFLFLSASLFAQREADNWIFGECAGLNFTTGDPVPIFIINLESDFFGTVMSDSLGNVLFYFSGNHVWNRNYMVMMNGDNILPSTHGDIWSRRYIAFPKPGMDSRYYIFSISHYDFVDGMYYSVIDMELDGGLGGVTSEKNIRLTAADYAQDKIFVLENATGDGYWVITRLFADDRYASFRVTENGVDPDPVYSPTGIYRELSSGSGPMRVSPDKKYLISCYHASPYPNESNVEINSFNARTGVVTFMYTIKNQDIGMPSTNLVPIDCETSPDSKKLYIHWTYGSNEGIGIYQYDMTLIENAASFQNSSIRLLMNNDFNHLQLSNDGRIYFQYSTYDQDFQDKYLGVINKPWEDGLACDVDTQGVYLGGRNAGWTLPTILLDYLYRFEWEGDPCQYSQVRFIPNFRPTPDSILWFFDEFAPGSISHELSPAYTFQEPGIHEVSVDIWYPTGRFEHTSREIEIFPSPEPDLGPDTLICEGSSIQLYPNCDADFFAWSNGQFGVPSITVSDSGTYWVRGTYNASGCMGYDTIHISFHPPTIIDETNLVITPTTCNGASGSITGLYALGPTPYAFIWKDLSGNPFGTNIDATGLPAGQYQLTITYGNSCETVSEIFTIEDAGNLQVLDVQLTQPHCGRPDGQIVVHAFSPSGTVLEYSIDDGLTYQVDSVFTGLIGTSYVVRVTDEFGCDGFYLSNPVILVDIPGPQVTQVNITNETEFLGNGAIEIVANGSTPVIYYSIDSGQTWKENDGNFENLESKNYNIVIKDDNGCDTSFTVEIQNIILTYLQAITGPGEHCLGDAVTIPIEVENFKSVAAFRLQLSFNKDNLQCEGYTNADPQLQQNLTAWVDQAAGEITFQWQDTVALTFTQPDTVAELVFTSKQPGLGDIGWYTEATESYFMNISGSSIPAEFQTGEVEIYETPVIFMADFQAACEGQMTGIMGTGWSNHPPITYLWIYPTGDTVSSDPFFFSITQADAGDYTLLVTDGMHCTEEKTIRLEVNENPVAAFHGTDTLEMHAGDVLDAGAGMVAYKWNTGDTTESIIIPSVGMYSVGMESLFGCTGTDSIYVKLTSDEIPSNNIFIPNAFSPDNDGLNDIFMAYATSDYIQKFHMLIFDRWGGQIFESNDIMLGWDGTKHGAPLPGGMYTYKITYSIYPSFGDYSEQLRLGTVMLVR
jgi:gliding motility-associated-like protein